MVTEPNTPLPRSADDGEHAPSTMAMTRVGTGRDGVDGGSTSPRSTSPPDPILRPRSATRGPPGRCGGRRSGVRSLRGADRPRRLRPAVARPVPLPGPADGGGLHARLPRAGPARRHAPTATSCTSTAPAPCGRWPGGSRSSARRSPPSGCSACSSWPASCSASWRWSGRGAARRPPRAGLIGVLITTTAIGLTALAWNGAVALGVIGLWVGLRARRWLAASARAWTERGRERRSDRLLLLSGRDRRPRPCCSVPTSIIGVTLGYGGACWGLGAARFRRWGSGWPSASRPT